MFTEHSSQGIKLQNIRMRVRGTNDHLGVHGLRGDTSGIAWSVTPKRRGAFAKDGQLGPVLLLDRP